MRSGIGIRSKIVKANCTDLERLMRFTSQVESIAPITLAYSADFEKTIRNVTELSVLSICIPRVQKETFLSDAYYACRDDPKRLEPTAKMAITLCNIPEKNVEIVRPTDLLIAKPISNAFNRVHTPTSYNKYSEEGSCPLANTGSLNAPRFAVSLTAEGETRTPDVYSHSGVQKIPSKFIYPLQTFQFLRSDTSLCHQVSC
nr:hypothetical protein Iba_chr10eCG14010 [Ipomoea batatas]